MRSLKLAFANVYADEIFADDISYLCLAIAYLSICHRPINEKSAFPVLSILIIYRLNVYMANAPTDALIFAKCVK